MTTTITAPCVTTLAFRLVAQAVTGHVVAGDHTRARALVEHLRGEQLDSLAQAAATVALLAHDARGGTPCG